MNADPFGAGIQQRQSQYSQMGYGPGPSNSGYLQTQQIFGGDQQFMPSQPMDAFSTPLPVQNAGQNFGGPPPMMQ